MPKYELTESKKIILLAGLDIMIAYTQKSEDSFNKGEVLAEMFETKEVLQHHRLTYKD